MQHTFTHTSLMDRRKYINNTSAHVSFDSVFYGKKNVLIEGGTIFDNTDGCAKEYRCATALHLLSIFSTKMFCIDRAIWAPGHGKYLVDALNSCDKQHLKRYMKHMNQMRIWIKRWYKTQKREENATIGQIHYNVTDVDDKTVHHNLIYQLTSLSLTKITI